MRKSEVEKAVKNLNEIDAGDPERAHKEADQIILDLLPTEVKEAYDGVVDRSWGWWFA